MGNRIKFMPLAKIYIDRGEIAANRPAIVAEIDGVPTFWSEVQRRIVLAQLVNCRLALVATERLQIFADGFLSAAMRMNSGVHGARGERASKIAVDVSHAHVATSVLRRIRCFKSVATQSGAGCARFHDSSLAGRSLRASHGAASRRFCARGGLDSAQIHRGFGRTCPDNLRPSAGS
jgi:hypothetical protein